jgi:hypothetical protein
MGYGLNLASGARPTASPTPRPRRRTLAAPYRRRLEAPPAAGEAPGGVGSGAARRAHMESLRDSYDVLEAGRCSARTRGTGMRLMASYITARSAWRYRSASPRWPLWPWMSSATLSSTPARRHAFLNQCRSAWLGALRRSVKPLSLIQDARWFATPLEACRRPERSAGATLPALLAPVAVSRDPVVALQARCRP